MGQGSARPGGHSGANNSAIPELFGSDPSVSPGLPRPVGWRVALPDGSAAWDKTGTADIDWTPVDGGASGPVTSISTPDNVIQAQPGTGAAILKQNLEATFVQTATFGGKPRFFAVDASVVVSGQGWSDVSQAAAGAVAVKTIAEVLQLLPRFGQGRACRVAIASGNYATDLQVVLDGINGVASTNFNSLLIIGTGTNATAGAVKFAGDTNDSLYMGFVTATGANASGYNMTAYALAADGTPTFTAQLAGGGSPGWTANSTGRPYGCRIRFDVNTTTPALRNAMSSINLTSGAATGVLASALPASPVVGDDGDVFYIEMPGVTGPNAILISGSGELDLTSYVPVSIGGLSAGALNVNRSCVAICGCESGNASFTLSSVRLQDTIFDDVASGFSTAVRGPSLRATSVTAAASKFYAAAAATTSTTTVGFTWQDCMGIVWERSASATGYAKFGGGTGAGNTTIDVIGTNGSTAHGGTCQVFGTAAAASGATRAGGYIGGGGYHGRVAYTNMGANPAIAIAGSGQGVLLLVPTGSTGNTGVGLSLQAGVAQGCTIAFVGTPTVTGAGGDVQLANGQITTWAALLATGLADTQGNRFISATGPLQVIRSFSGPLIDPGGGSGTSTFASDIGIQQVAAASLSADVQVGYPVSARLVTRIRGCAPLGSDTGQTYMVMKNGAPTALTCSVPGGSPPYTTAEDTNPAHAVLFADGDLLDVHVSTPGPMEGNEAFSGTVEGPS